MNLQANENGNRNYDDRRTIMRRTTDHDLLKGDIVGGSNPPREKD